MDDQRKDHPNPERLPKSNHHKQLQTNNVHTDDVDQQRWIEILNTTRCATRWALGKHSIDSVDF